jgi:iron complex transport system substrate-binding protein
MLAVLLGGCGTQGDRATVGDGTRASPLTIDSCGHAVTFEAAPRKVLTIGPTAVYQLHAAGASERIVARAGEFGGELVGPAASAVEDVPVIDPEDPAREPILAAGVDAVIHNGLFETTREDLEDVGIKSVFTAGTCGLASATGGETTDSSGADLEDVYRDLEQFGELFGTEPAARRTLADLRRRVAAVTEHASDFPRRRAAAVYFFPGSPASVSGNRSMVHAQMELLHLDNVFADLDRDFVEGNVEALISRDPDVLIVPFGFAGESFEEVKRKLIELPGIDRVAAVREGRVIGVPSYQRAPDVNAVKGLETLARALAEHSD